MDFNDVFSNTDILGMAVKQHLLTQVKNAIKDLDKDFAIALLKIQIECCEEVIKELEEQV